MAVEETCDFSFYPEDSPLVESYLGISDNPFPASFWSAVDRIRESGSSVVFAWQSDTGHFLRAKISKEKDSSRCWVRIESECKSEVEQWRNLDDIQLGVAVYDSDLKAVYVNGTFSEMLKLHDTSDYIGKTPGNFMSAEDKSHLLDSMRRLLDKPGVKVTKVLRTHMANGEYAWFKGTIQRVTWKNANYIMAFLEDVSEETAVNQRLERSEERLRSMFYHAQGGAVLANSKGEIIAANDAFCRMLGYTDEKELRGTAYPDLTAVEDSQAERALVDELLEKRLSHYRIEKRYLHKDGHSIWGDAIVSAIWGEGEKPENYIAIVQDIQKAKENERELRDLNAMKDKFFSIIGHDLRNPVNAILGLTELAGHTLNAGDLDESKAMVEMIQTSTLRLNELLENVLQWSRSQQGLLTFKPERVYLDEKVQTVFDILSVSAHKKGVHLKQRVPENAVVFADCDMLKSVLLNLVTNALKYSHRGQSVEVVVRKSDGNWRMEVKDCGVGMSQIQIDALFSADDVKRRTGTEQEQGSGLGLLLVQEFLQAHSSQLEVDSTVNQGTTMSFVLPAYKD